MLKKKNGCVVLESNTYLYFVLNVFGYTYMKFIYFNSVPGDVSSSVQSLPVKPSGQTQLQTPLFFINPWF